MKSKKTGFTLIELLAVIVILGIIALISTPVVLNIINDAKKETFENSTLNVFKAAELYEAKNNFKKISTGGIALVDENLPLESNNFTGGKIIRNENEQLEIVNVTDGVYCAKGVKEDIKVVRGNCNQLDDSAPINTSITITNITSSSFRVIASGEDLESGINKYEFSIDGINYISKTINNHNFTNLELNKTYTVYLRITNNNSLSSEVIKSDVTTKDIILPTYSIDASGWQTQKIVTINYPEREANFVYDYSIDGGNSWNIVEGNIEKVTFDKNGSVIARIFDGTNYKISSSYAVSEIDTTAPINVSIFLSTLTTNTIKVVASGEDLESDIIKYEFSIDDNPYLNNGTNNTYTFTNVTSGSHNIKAKLTNGAGLSTESNILSIAPAEITIPTYNIDNIGWQVSKIVTITYPVREIGFVYEYSINGGTSWETVSTGTRASVTFNENGSIIARIFDGTNYKTASTYTVSKIDTTIPTNIGIALINKTTNTITVTSSGIDTESGITKYEFSIDGESYINNGTNDTYTFTNVTTGSHKIKTRITNGSGLIAESIELIVEPNEIIAPTYSIDAFGWQTQKIVTINYPTREEGFIYEYSTDGGTSWEILSTGTKISVTFNKNGSIIARIYDGTNYKTASSYTVSEVDSTAPTGVSVTLSSKTTNTISVTSSGIDTESGITKYEYSIDDGAYVSNGTNNTYTFVGVITGNHIIKVRLTNASGLTTESSSITVATNEIEPPTYSIDKSGWQTQKIVTITYPTREPGFIYQYSIDEGSSWTTVSSGVTVNVTFNANGNIIARIYDGTNYKNGSSYAVTGIDTTSPTGVSAVVSSKTTNTIVVVANGIDSESGIAKYEYSIDGGGFISNGTTSTYTFTSVTAGNHTVKVRLTNGSGLTTESTILTVSPNEIVAPTYGIDSSGWRKQKIVTITYPTRQSGFIYEYSINGGDTWTTISSGVTATVTFTSNGNVIARIYDGTNYKTASTYSVSQIDTTLPVISSTLAGSMIHLDPTFISGLNTANIYNNLGNGTVSVTRVSDATSPTGSGYSLKVTTNGSATPGLGGFYQSVNSRAGAVYFHRILAKIPVGYTINRASNAVGNDATHIWITSQEGTGNWQEYIYVTRAGTTGTFSSFGHVYISGTAATSSNPVTWYVAYATIYDTAIWGSTNSVLFEASDNESGITLYGINQSSTTEPSYTTISSTTNLAKAILNLTTNGTYYIWVKDAAGNVNKKAITVSYIDSNNPTITAKAGSFTITQGASNVISSAYFNINQNGNASIASTNCIDTSKGNAAVTNTSTLAVGNHVITCTVTKTTGKFASASTTIVVNPATVLTTETITFEETTTMNRSKSVTLTGFNSIVSVTVNNGTVSYSLNGSSITATVNSGTSTYKSVCGQEYSCYPALVCYTSCWSCSESYTGTCCGCPGDWPTNRSCCVSENSCGWSNVCRSVAHYSYVVTVKYNKNV